MVFKTFLYKLYLITKCLPVDTFFTDARYKNSYGKDLYYDPRIPINIAENLINVANSEKFLDFSVA